jgi:hypothetical protein
MAAEGFWDGTVSTGDSVALIVLENGDTWGFYTSVDGTYSMISGKTNASGGQMSGSWLDVNFMSRTAKTTSFAGSVVAKKSLNAQLSTGGTLTASYDSSYDQRPSLSAAAGTYTGAALTGATQSQPTAVILSSTGSFTMSTMQDCSARGTVQPRASGKNVFDIEMRFQGGGCGFGDDTPVLRGITLYDPVERTLLTLVTNDAKNGVLLNRGQK